MSTGFLGRLDHWFERFCTIGVPEGASEEFVARMRAEQLRVFRRLMPVMMIGTIVNVVVLFCVFFGRTNSVALSLWAVASIAMALEGLRGWRAVHGRPAKQTASLRSIKRATFNSGLMALIWAYTDYLFVEHAGANEMLIVAAIKAGMMGAGGFGLATIPSAAIAYAALVGLPSLAALMSVGGMTMYGLAVILVTYYAIIANIVHSTFTVFVERQLAEAAREQLVEFGARDDGRPGKAHRAGRSIDCRLRWRGRRVARQDVECRGGASPIRRRIKRACGFRRRVDPIGDGARRKCERRDRLVRILL